MIKKIIRYTIRAAVLLLIVGVLILTAGIFLEKRPYKGQTNRDFAKDTMDFMMDSIAQTSEMFTMDNETASGNVSFWHGKKEAHSYHAKRRYLYNALPVFSALIGTAADL